MFDKRAALCKVENNGIVIKICGVAMAVDSDGGYDGKSNMYALAVMASNRRFHLKPEEKNTGISMRLIELHGLEQTIELGMLEFAEKSDFNYGGRCVAQESLKQCCLIFASALDDMEQHSYRSHILKSSIPEFECLLQGKPTNIALLQRAYWVLYEEPITEVDLKMQDAELLLRTAKACSAGTLTDRIFVGGLHVVSRIWNGNKMLFTPITYYIAPVTSDGCIVEPQSLQFKRELMQSCAAVP